MIPVFGTDPALGTDPSAGSQAGSLWGYVTQGASVAANILTAIKGKPATGTGAQAVPTAAQQAASQKKLLIIGGLVVAGLLAVGLFIVAMFKTRGTN